MFKRTPWYCSVFNQEIAQIPKGGLSLLRTWDRSNRKKDVKNQRYVAQVHYNFISRWEHSSPLQVTGNIDVQIIVPLLVLENLPIKTQLTRHSLIHCKYRVNQFSGPTYLVSIIFPAFWTHMTRRISLAWLLQTIPESILANIMMTLMKFLLVLIIDILLPCRISIRTLWGPLKVMPHYQQIWGSKGAHNLWGYYGLDC